jgi:hypothetical protein
LVIEGPEDFKGSFDRLCLRAGTAAIEAMLAADAGRRESDQSENVYRLSKLMLNMPLQMKSRPSSMLK